MILLDTMVFSEPAKRRPDASVIAWLAGLDEAATFVSVITIGEVERGIAVAAGRDPLYARRLAVWLGRTLADYGDRVLHVDVQVARTWGRDLHRRRETSPDLLIAATALHHSLSVATRNVRDFVWTGVAVVNPWLAGDGAT